jgi:hypothetical protein
VHSPRAFPWELQLPWAPITLKYVAGPCLERVDRDCGLACARGAIVSICQRVGTGVTVTTWTVSGKSVVGRRRGARPSIARTPRLDFAMPRRRRSAANELRSRPSPLRTWTLRPRVVTRQKIFFRFRSVIGRVAMKPRWRHSVIRHATVVRTAVEPFATSWIENASGRSAAP